MSHDIGTLSPSESGMSDFKECLRHLRDQHPEEALVHVWRALEIAPKNPFYLSYTGLLVAVSEERFTDGEKLCLEAIGLKHNHSQLYLNLAEVYQKAGRPLEAVEILKKGLVSTGRDPRIRRALLKTSTRREPMLSFLHRGHPLNQILGKWRHLMIGALIESRII